MLFREKHVGPILDGVKTQTRRIKKGKRKVGSLFPFQTGIYKKAFARARFLDMREELLLDISPEDIRAEGYETREDFLRAFSEINKMEPEQLTGLKVWVFEFRVEEKLQGIHHTVVQPDEPNERTRKIADGPGPGGRM